MADDLDDLRRLAPEVDAARAREAFRRRRRRSRTARRGALGAAAVSLVAVGVVAITTNQDDGVPVVAGPAEDLPIVWAREPASSHGGELALLAGEVHYDPAHGCFSLGVGEQAAPVVWPAGTVGTADGPGVVLPDGQIARVGDEVAGSGGYGDVADDFSIPRACRSGTGGVAMFNPNAELQVTVAPATPAGSPTCAQIVRFADQLVDTGITYDATPTASPEAALADADLVISGTLTGRFETDFDDADRALGRVGYEVDVQSTSKSPPGAFPTDPLTIWIAVNPTYGPDGAPFRDAIVPGIPVVVVADAYDAWQGFAAILEGFATGCPGRPPIGFVSRYGGWADVASLDDLARRLGLSTEG